jgi:hypothetical protein
MPMHKTHAEYTTYGFTSKTKIGEIQTHAWHAPMCRVTGAYATHVVFSHPHDDVAECPIEVTVHCSHLTKYMANTWPNAGSVCAVILNNGQNRWAKSYKASQYNQASWDRTPGLMRLPFRIAALCSDHTLLEIAGGSQWCYSLRRPEDASLILDPCARDNKAYAERMAALQKS